MVLYMLPTDCSSSSSGGCSPEFPMEVKLADQTALVEPVVGVELVVLVVVVLLTTVSSWRMSLKTHSSR